MGEVHQHLLYLSIQIYQHPIRGFTDRRKALDKAINEMLPQDNSYRNFAMNMVVKDYKLKKLKYPIPVDATQRFYALVNEYVRKAEQKAPLEEPGE
jgi:hypothetical protein